MEPRGTVESQSRACVEGEMAFRIAVSGSSRSGRKRTTREGLAGQRWRAAFVTGGAARHGGAEGGPAGTLPCHVGLPLTRSSAPVQGLPESTIVLLSGCRES